MSLGHIASGTTAKATAALLRELKTPYSDGVLRHLKMGTEPEFPVIHEDRKEFMKDYLAYNLMRKCRTECFGVALPSDDELLQKAVSGFLEVEKVCKYVNINGYIPGTAPTSDMLAPEVVIHTARRKIAEALGPFDLDEFARSIDFSGGASTRLPRRKAAAPMKFTGKPHVTRNCALLALNLIWFHEPWRRYCQDRFGRESDPFTWVTIVEGSEYFTVPKTARTLRGACKEAELNMLCQKAQGNMLRRRLRAVGIDLNDQTVNQYLAGCGSRTGALATIDLSNASDSVSLVLLDLLPWDWKRYLLMTRSEKVKLPDGSWHTLEKVSSMGNGFTFELESLIFWALAASVVSLRRVSDRRIGVYGDDIIVHASCAPDLINVLAYCGFSTNISKTYVDGPFRESCGKHYHYGVDVTPFFVREALDIPGEEFHFLNQLNEWYYRAKGLGISLGQTHDYVHRLLLPKGRIPFIPPHLGTKCGLIARSVADALGTFFCLRKQGYVFWAFTSSAKVRKMSSAPGYLTWLLKTNFGTPGEITVGDGAKPRRRVRAKALYTSEWCDSNVVLPHRLSLSE